MKRSKPLRPCVPMTTRSGRVDSMWCRTSSRAPPKAARRSIRQPSRTFEDRKSPNLLAPARTAPSRSKCGMNPSLPVGTTTWNASIAVPWCPWAPGRAAPMRSSSASPQVTASAESGDRSTGISTRRGGSRSAKRRTSTGHRALRTTRLAVDPKRCAPRVSAAPTTISSAFSRRATSLSTRCAGPSSTWRTIDPPPARRSLAI